MKIIQAADGILYLSGYPGDSHMFCTKNNEVYTCIDKPFKNIEDVKNDGYEYCLIRGSEIYGMLLGLYGEPVGA